MFKEKYKKAYDGIAPSQELFSEVVRRADEKAGKRRYKHKAGRAAEPAVAAAAVFLCFILALPACAANVPAFYRVVEYISPELADRLVPIEKSSSSQGITMEVEAVDLDGSEAEIIVSMRDDETSTADRIHGQVDLFDSYNLFDYGSELVIGGCSFLTYDEETGKAYFRITVQASGTYQADKLHFSVNEILCDKSSEKRKIDLPGTENSAATRLVSLSGMSGTMEQDDLPDSLKRAGGTEDDPGWRQDVLDLMDAADCASDDFTVTGAVYMEDVLRVQICMGDNHHADRHVQPFLVDAEGNEKHEDYSVSWNEETQDTSYQFYEYWFVGELDNIEDYSMYGIFHNSGESIEGTWEVTFRAE